MAGRLQGRVAVITGAGSIGPGWGNGKATAVLFAREGAQVSGERLREEFLKEYGLSQNQLAKAIGISPNRIAEIVGNRRRISAGTALSRSALRQQREFWLNLQTHHDLKMARRQRSAEDAQRIKAHRAA